MVANRSEEEESKAELRVEVERNIGSKTVKIATPIDPMTAAYDCMEACRRSEQNFRSYDTPKRISA